MTIDEMITELQRRREMHGVTPVRATWEGIVREITPENIYFTADATSGGDPCGPCLWIDAGDNSYRPAGAV